MSAIERLVRPHQREHVWKWFREVWREKGFALHSAAFRKYRRGVDEQMLEIAISNLAAYVEALSEESVALRNRIVLLEGER